MCGRFTNTVTNPQDLQESFDVDEVRVDEIQARYNIAPTQSILTIVADSEGSRYLGEMRWGLIPSWNKDLKRLNGHINARSETASEKPTFGSAFKKRRCLIVADGFYEWKVHEDGTKTPMYIHVDNQEPFGMAGLWERWEHPETGEVYVTSTILTTSANDMMKELHHRMPVILPKENYGQWLDPNQQDKEVLQAYLTQYPAEHMHAYAVSTLVNNVRNDNPDLLKPAS